MRTLCGFNGTAQHETPFGLTLSPRPASSARVRTILAFLIMAAASLLAPRIEAAPRTIETVKVDGVTYLRARSWADANGLEPAWVVRDKTIQFARPAAKIQLTVNSVRITFNGLLVVLSRPVIYQNGAVYFSKLDAETVLNPLLSPPRLAAGKKIKTICLDAGHGGIDPGYIVNSKQEKKYTLLFAQEVRDSLTKQGFKVVMTRTQDTYVDLPDRAEYANRMGADLFVSLHFNAFPQDKDVNGAETYCVTPAGASSSNARGVGAGTGASRGNANNAENVCLAYQLQKSLVRSAGSDDRGVKRARFQVLCEAAMPAVLIETGFMSNANEGKRIFDARSRKTLVKAVVDGIVAYKKSAER